MERPEPDVLLNHIKRYHNTTQGYNQPALVPQLLLHCFDCHLYQHMLDCLLPHFPPACRFGVSHCKKKLQRNQEYIDLYRVKKCPIFQKNWHLRRKDLVPLVTWVLKTIIGLLHAVLIAIHFFVYWIILSHIFSSNEASPFPYAEKNFKKCNDLYWIRKCFVFWGKNNTFQTKRTQDRTLVKKKKDRKSFFPKQNSIVAVVILKRTYRKWRFSRARRPTKINVVTAKDDPMAMVSEDVCCKITLSSFVSAVKQQNTIFHDSVSHFLRAFA